MDEFKPSRDEQTRHLYQLLFADLEPDEQMELARTMAALLAEHGNPEAVGRALGLTPDPARIQRALDEAAAAKGAPLDWREEAAAIFAEGQRFGEEATRRRDHEADA